jgi:c(7)-type cytochrome triheme protein
MTLKLFLAATMGAFASLAVSLTSSNVLSQQLPTPEDFRYEETKPLGPVSFSHKLHVTEKKLPCQDCHPQPFQMKKLAAVSEMTMPRLDAGEFCGTCHNGDKAFTTKDVKACAKCHGN